MIILLIKNKWLEHFISQIQNHQFMKIIKKCKRSKIQNHSYNQIPNRKPKRIPMFLSHHQSHLTKTLKQYFEPKSYRQNSLSQQLKDITQWVRHYRNDQMEEVQKIIKGIEILVGKLKFTKVEKENKSGPQWLLLMKSLMLVHHLLCIGVNGNIFEELLEKINSSLHKLEQHNANQIKQQQTNSRNKPSSTLTSLFFNQQTVMERLLTPYHHYLTRRCQLLPKSFSQQGKCHYLINLMNSACKCNEVIYIFARYKNFDQFGVMGEFNLVMAKDIGLLYGLLKGYLMYGEEVLRRERNSSEINQMGFRNSFEDSLEQTVRVQDIDDILLSLHDKLFHIFYNKYHYIKVEPYVPDWIDLDANYSVLNNSKLTQSTKFNSIKSHHRLNKSSKKPSVLEDTTASLNSSQKNAQIDDKIEKSLELISDMERFLEVFDEIVV